MRSGDKSSGTWWLLLALLLAPGPALADAIGPPPEHCPNGSIPESSHAGEYCWPSTCTSSADCEQGQECVERALCIEPVQGYSRGGPFTVDHAVTSCGADGNCPAGSTCISDLRCMPKGATFGGDGPSQTTLYVVVGATVVFAVLVLLAVVVMVVVGVIRKKKKKDQQRRA